ncbi:MULTISPECIES: hypothetical protein [Enterobacterales]|uniref:hypothetical protein n=1 Tax=Enterobacterales TaxID=91347 RepID=UPI002ED86403
MKAIISVQHNVTHAVTPYGNKTIITIYGMGATESIARQNAFCYLNHGTNDFEEEFSDGTCIEVSEKLKAAHLDNAWETETDGSTMSITAGDGHIFYIEHVLHNLLIDENNQLSYGDELSLVNYIRIYYGGVQRRFSEAAGVSPAQVTQWINAGFIVENHKLKSPPKPTVFRRDLPVPVAYDHRAQEESERVVYAPNIDWTDEECE